MKDKYTAAYRRFKEIDSMIREGSASKHFKKVSDMAAALGVSKRTVERDILYMSSSDIALPIQYDEKNHTYYYLPEDLKKKSFGNILLNNSDKQFISLARSLLLSFFSGTDSYYEAYKTFDTLMGRFDHAQEFLKHPMRETMLLALPKKTQLDDINKIVPFINRGECIIAMFGENAEMENLIRPIHIIYAWSNWYLLYVDETFAYRAEDFKIIKTDAVRMIRGATEFENGKVPHIEYTAKGKKTYDYAKPVHTACKIASDYQDENDMFEYLAVDIYGNTCEEYALKFRKKRDDNLILVESKNFSDAKFETRDTNMFIKILDSL